MPERSTEEKKAVILVTGGLAQGKLDWALARSGYTMEQTSPDPASTVPILTGLEELVRGTLEKGGEPESLLPALLEKEYVLCREVGAGIVPIDPMERRWREETGRLCCKLAERAGGVVRLWCGIPQWLKGGEG